MSIERKARILNGMIVLIASLLTLLDERFIWIVLFMGVSLIFSGVADYCGFALILKRCQRGDEDNPGERCSR